MQIYCINLDRSEDRLRHMTGVFAGLGLGFTRVAAVDGGALSEADLSIYGGRALHPLTKGEIGCFLSHAALWQRIATGEDPFAAIFEDDIHVSRHLADFLNDISPMTALPFGADLIKLETMGTRVVVGRHPLGEIGATHLHTLHSRHLGAAVYIISREAARYWVEQADARTFPSDCIFLNDTPQFKKLNIIQVVPALAIQEYYHNRNARQDFGSLIDEMSAMRKHNPLPLSGKIVREIRRGLFRLKTFILWSVSMRWLRFIRMKVPFQRADALSIK